MDEKFSMDSELISKLLEAFCIASDKYWKLTDIAAAQSVIVSLFFRLALLHCLNFQSSFYFPLIFFFSIYFFKSGLFTISTIEYNARKVERYRWISMVNVEAKTDPPVRTALYFPFFSHFISLYTLWLLSSQDILQVAQNYLFQRHRYQRLLPYLLHCIFHIPTSYILCPN